MAKQKKNSYRLRFSIDDKRPEFTAHTQSEAASIQLHVRRLVKSKQSGVPCLESETWAQTRPKGALRDFLVKWGLLADNSDNEKTLKDLFEHFQKRGVEQGTLDTYRFAFYNLFDFFGENKRLRDITPKDAGEFETFLNTAARRDKRKSGESGLRRQTAKKRIQRVKQFFREGRRLKWIDADPFEGLHGANLPNKERWFYVTKKMALEVMANTPNLEIRALIALSRFAGARGKSEFDSLEWSPDWIIWSADGKQGTIRLHRKKTEESGFADSIIPMSEPLEKALRDLYDSVPTGTVRVFKPRNNPGKVAKDQFLRSGINILSPYNLRRSFCRNVMESGVDPRAYEAYTGHSFATGMKWYQQWDSLRARKNAPKLLEALSSLDLCENLSPQFSPQLPPKNAPSSFLQFSADTNENNGLSLEIRSSCDKQKPFAGYCKGLELGNRDLNPD